MNGRTTGEQPSDRRVPVANLEEVLRLYRDTYFDLNMRHFHEKLSEEHGIELSYTLCKKRARSGRTKTSQAPPTKRTAAAARHVAAHWWQQAPVVRRRALVRPDRDSG